MDEIHASIPAQPLAAWPSDQLERVWRLSTGAVRSTSADDPRRLRRLEAQAAAVGEELVRRGCL